MAHWLTYTAAAVLFMGVGALISGLSVHYATTATSNGGNELNQQTLGDERRHAKCLLAPSDIGGNIAGTIFFTQETENSEVIVTGNITGLSVGKHGFHIHTYGVKGGNCGEAAGHYNPDNFTHGAPTSPERHVGDLGNIESFPDGTGEGTAVVYIIDKVISLHGAHSILGRAVMVHKGEDDLGKGDNPDSLITGNAGPRLACCTIFIAP